MVAVGGTELTVTEAGARKSETVWNEDPDPEGGNEGAGGGGCSTQFAAPAWQRDGPRLGLRRLRHRHRSQTRRRRRRRGRRPLQRGARLRLRGIHRIASCVIGGTSVASPIVASVFALAGGAHGVAYPAQTLYSRLGSPAGFPSLYDVTEGGNGKCDGAYRSGCSGSMSPLSPLDCGKDVLICNAAPGYDGPTGVGAPNGVAAFEPESAAEHVRRVAAEAKAAEEKKTLEEQQKAKEAEQKLEEETRAAEARKAEEAIRAAEARKAEEERVAAEKLKEEEEAEEARQRLRGRLHRQRRRGSRSGRRRGSGAGQLTTGSGGGQLGGFPQARAPARGGPPEPPSASPASPSPPARAR